jgi:tRNA threonylcarbamoyladenosine biosynthesis protein TsaE
MTHALGVHLGRTLREGDIVCLQGELGSGKTHLTKGIAAGLEVSERVTSPTFIIVNEYVIPGRRYRLYHIDLYRVESLAEALATGLDEYWSGGDICVIEWAERARPILPVDHLWVNLDYCGPVSRRLVFEASGPRSVELLGQIEPRLHEECAKRDGSGEVSTCS